MYQIETSNHSEEVSQFPQDYDLGNGNLPRDESNESAIVLIDSEKPSSEASGFFDEMSGPQLIALLVGLMFLAAIIFWFFDNIDERWERIGRRINRWRSKGRGDYRIEFPIASGELELPANSNRDSSASSLVEPTPFLDSERGIDDLFPDKRQQDPSAALETAIQNDIPVESSETGSAGLEKIALSLNEKLDATTRELDRQRELTQESELRVKESENQTQRLKEELANLTQQNVDSESANSQIDSLKQELDDKTSELKDKTSELDDKTSELEKLQAALDDANSKRTQDADSLLEQSELQQQKLADELAEARETENQTRSELADAKEQLELLVTKSTRVEQEMETAYQELLGKNDTEQGLKSELTSLQSKIEQSDTDAAELKKQLDTQAEKHAAELANQATQLQELENSLEQTKASADQREVSLEEADLRCQKLTDELVEVKQSKDKSESDLANAKEEINTLTSKANQFQSDLETANQEIIAKTDLAESLLERNTGLNSDLEKLDNLYTGADSKAKELTEFQENAQARLQQEIESREQVAGELDTAKQEIAELIQLSDEFKSKLASHDAEHEKAIENLQVSLDESKSNESKFAKSCDELNAKIAEQESLLSATDEEVATLKSEIAKLSQDTELELSGTKKMLSQEQALHNELKEAAKRNSEELSLQIAKFSEQESRMESLRGQAEESQYELAETLKLVDQQKLSLAQFEENQQTQTRKIGELASKNAQFQSSLEPLEQRVQEAENELAQTKKLLANEQAAHAEIKISAQQFEDELSQKDAKYAKLESKLQELNQSNADSRAAESKQLEQQSLKINKLQTAFKQERELLAETKQLLENEQAAYAELNKATQQFEDELEQKNAQYAKLESELQQLTQSNADNQAAESKQLEQQSLKINELQSTIEQERDLLAETKQLLSSEQATNAELKNASQRFENELQQKNAQYAKLESKLQQLTQSNTENQAAESKQLEQQQLKINELQTSLENERQLRAEISEKQEASRIRLQELENAGAASVDQEKYEELALKLVQYKKAYRKSKSLIDGLNAQKTEMSDLATEYLSAAKILRRDLDEQLHISQQLKSKLGTAASSTDAANEADINQLAEKRARTYVLKLKSQFEQRLKEKNDLIRKLQNHQMAESSID